MASTSTDDWIVLSSNTTSNTIVTVQRDPFMARVELAILTAMLTVSVLGNGLALLALKLRHRKLSRMRFFFLHLCVADLVVAVFHILSQLLLDAVGGFPEGDVGSAGFAGDRTLCKIVMYMQMLGPYSSSYVLVATAIDRYQVICFPLSNCSWTPKRSQAMVIAAWLLAATFDVPQLFVFDYFYGEYGRFDCFANFAHPWGERIYVLWVTMAIFIVPFFIIVYTYTCICRVIWINFRQKSKYVDGWQPHQQQPQISAAVDVQQVNVVVGGAYRFKGKCKVEVTLCPGGNDKRSGAGASLGGVHPRAHSVSGISRAKIKTIKMTVIVIVCYVACYSPFYISMLYVTWYPEARHFAFYSSPAFTILALLASLNSCVNPWLYLAFNENLTKTLKDLFCCRLRGGTDWNQTKNFNAFSRSSLSEAKSSIVQQQELQKKGKRMKATGHPRNNRTVNSNSGTAKPIVVDVLKEN